ncbi:hypothetical protein MKW92_023457 [Papaver armeniacum]|nr:hypothetical protein MKW92_023457 [Papaver armeniacum]
MTSNSSTPSTSPNESNNKQEKPRFFDDKAKSLCWEKAELLIGRGEFTAENCRILQSRVYRYQSDRDLEESVLKGFSCDDANVLTAAFDIFLLSV